MYINDQSALRPPCRLSIFSMLIVHCARFLVNGTYKWQDMRTEGIRRWPTACCNSPSFLLYLLRTATASRLPLNLVRYEDRICKNMLHRFEYSKLQRNVLNSCCTCWQRRRIPSSKMQLSRLSSILRYLQIHLHFPLFDIRLIFWISNSWKYLPVN